MKQLVLQSNKENITRAEELVMDICDEHNVQNYCGVITVAVMHAVENAMEHGNHFDSSKQVTLSWGCCRGGLFFEVADEGNGFRFEDFGDFPTQEGRGEGVFMMKTLADKVVFSDEGRRVRLEFVIEGINSTDQMERTATLQKFFQSTLVNA